MAIPKYEEFRELADVWRIIDKCVSITIDTHGRSTSCADIHRIVFSDPSYSNGDGLLIDVTSKGDRILRGDENREQLEQYRTDVLKAVSVLPAYKFIRSNTKIMSAIKGIFIHFKANKKRDFDKKPLRPNLELDIILFCCGLSYCYAEYMMEVNPFLDQKNPNIHDFCHVEYKRALTIVTNKLEAQQKFSKPRTRLEAIKDQVVLEKRKNQLKMMEFFSRNTERLPEKALVARLTYNFLSWSCLYDKTPIHDFTIGENSRFPSSDEAKEMVEAAGAANKEISKLMEQLAPSEKDLKQIKGRIHDLAGVIANHIDMPRLAPEDGKEHLPDYVTKYTFNRIETDLFKS